MDNNLDYLDAENTTVLGAVPTPPQGEMPQMGGFAQPAQQGFAQGEMPQMGGFSQPAQQGFAQGEMPQMGGFAQPNPYGQQMYGQQMYGQQFAQGAAPVKQPKAPKKPLTFPLGLNICRFVLMFGGLLLLIAPFLTFRSVKFEVEMGKKTYDQDDLFDMIDEEAEDELDMKHVVDDYHLDKISLVNMSGNINKALKEVEDQTGVELKASIGMKAIPWIIVLMGLIAIGTAFLKDYGSKFIPFVGSLITLVLVDSGFGFVNKNVDSVIKTLKPIMKAQFGSNFDVQGKFSAGLGFYCLVLGMLVILGAVVAEIVIDFLKKQKKA